MKVLRKWNQNAQRTMAFNFQKCNSNFLDSIFEEIKILKELWSCAIKNLPQQLWLTKYQKLEQVKEKLFWDTQAKSLKIPSLKMLWNLKMAINVQKCNSIALDTINEELQATIQKTKPL